MQCGWYKQNTIMEKIKSITEAYSQQPCSLQVETQAKYDGYKNLEFRETFCKEIKLEQVIIGDPSTGTVVMAYVGYGFKGQKLFQYLADSVNVHYEAV